MNITSNKKTKLKRPGQIGHVEINLSNMIGLSSGQISFKKNLNQNF